MKKNLISKCIEKAKSGRTQLWEEDGKKKFIGIYTKGLLSITYANPSEGLIVSYDSKMVLRARKEDGEYKCDKYVSGDWEHLI